MQTWRMRAVGVLLASADLVAARSLRRQSNGSVAPFSQPNELSQPRRALAGVMTNSNIRTAVAAWLSDSASAEATYGHISTWETSGVTDMSYLFCAESGWPHKCNRAAASFNDDIGAWDTSGVTDMEGMFYLAFYFNKDIGDWRVDSVEEMDYMFYKAGDFNQDLSSWRVDSVTSMSYMFQQARDFDQDLGWCVVDDVRLDEAFSWTSCASTSCGVIQGNCFTPAPSKSPMSRNSYDEDDDDDNDDDDCSTMILIIVALVLAWLLLCSCCVVRGEKVESGEVMLATEDERCSWISRPGHPCCGPGHPNSRAVGLCCCCVAPFYKVYRAKCAPAAEETAPDAPGVRQLELRTSLYRTPCIPERVRKLFLFFLCGGYCVMMPVSLFLLFPEQHDEIQYSIIGCIFMVGFGLACIIPGNPEVQQDNLRVHDTMRASGLGSFVTD